MNRIKQKERELLDLHREVVQHLRREWDHADANQGHDDDPITPNRELVARHQEAEPHRWAAIAKTDIQTGCMALVRAVAQPCG